MESWLSKQSAFLLLFLIKFLVFVDLPVSLCAYDWYSSCSNNRFNCGKITNVGYPFWGDARPDACGHPDLKLNCAKDITTIEIKRLTYRVLAVNESTKILKIVRDDYWGGICSPRLENTSLDHDLFDYGPGYLNITLEYGCTLLLQFDQMAIRFSCPINGSTGAIIYYLSSIPDLVGACKYNVKVPVVASAAAAAINLTEEALIEAIDGGFMLEWNASNGICDGCQRSGGLCGFNTSTNAFACHC
ncbi:hypothetical protein CIPAW_03G062400, partial [Carya illinoinensis]